MQPMRTMWHPDKANEADEANEAEVNEANAKADITNEADVDQCQQGKCQRDRSWRMLLDDAVAITLYSLAKYSAIVA